MAENSVVHHLELQHQVEKTEALLEAHRPAENQTVVGLIAALTVAYHCSRLVFHLLRRTLPWRLILMVFRLIPFENYKIKIYLNPKTKLKSYFSCCLIRS